MRRKPAPFPWKGWYHHSAHTFGSWMRGDPRGWRTRHHREHLEHAKKGAVVWHFRMLRPQMLEVTQ